MRGECVSVAAKLGVNRVTERLFGIYMALNSAVFSVIVGTSELVFE